MSRARLIIALAVVVALAATVAVVWTMVKGHGSNLSGGAPVAKSKTSESAASAKVAAQPRRHPPKLRPVRITDSSSASAETASSDSAIVEDQTSPEHVEFMKRLPVEIKFLERARGLSPEAAKREATARLSFRLMLKLRDDQLALAEKAEQADLDGYFLWNGFESKAKAVRDAAYSNGARGEVVDQSVHAALVQIKTESLPAIITARDNEIKELQKLRPNLDPEQTKSLDEFLIDLKNERSMNAEGLKEASSNSSSKP